MSVHKGSLCSISVARPPKLVPGIHEKPNRSGIQGYPTCIGDSAARWKLRAVAAMTWAEFWPLVIRSLTYFISLMKIPTTLFQQSLPTPIMATSASSIFEYLPSELISRIFFDLSSDSPGGIAACRLVSHGFKTHSSPFLLPYVIFSRQLGPLTKLRQVLDHPYFRQYVTRLVYDASEYAESTALDWDQYVDDCERAPRYLAYTELTDQKRRDNIAWEGLASFRSHTFTT